MAEDPYRNRLRLRTGGLLIEDDAILLVKIESPVIGKTVWMPPGGGMEFGESTEACLQREFKEETGLGIEVLRFGFLNELLELPYHAVELYFEVRRTGGSFRLGKDPEHGESQLIRDLKWVPLAELEEYDIAPMSLLEWTISHGSS